jgi:hypothetical protein
VCFVDDFADRIKKFLSIVPDDWDQLMIGGQHFNSYGEPQLVRPGIVQCADCQRLHCHAVRGTYMHLLLNRWRGGGLYNGLEHCDCIMGRDPELQLANKVYAPQMFLAGQENGQSDILGKPMPRKFWNPPDRNLMVVCLRAPDDVITAMEQFGFCVGRGCGRDGRLDLKLAAIFDTTRTSATARINQLRNWINLMQWELAADPQFVCTVAHPEATPAIVEAASLWQVRTIQADNLTDALAQAPQKLKKARPIPLLNKVKA